MPDSKLIIDQLENQLKNSSRINQAILSFSIIIIVFTSFSIVIYILCYSGRTCAILIILFKAILYIVNW